VAIAYYFKDDCNNELYQLGGARFEKIVEIIFLDPIGHRSNRYESFNLKKVWGEKIILNIILFCLQKIFVVWLEKKQIKNR